MLRMKWTLSAIALICLFSALTVGVACGGNDGIPGDSGMGADSSAPDSAPPDSAPPEDSGPSPDSGVDAGTPIPDAGPASCPAPSSCDVALPTYVPVVDWRHSIVSVFTTSQGPARHRGRDLLLRSTDDQWALAKFAYGLGDNDLEDEDVDMYILRNCTTWEYFGRATTTDDGTSPLHPTIERIEDDGGRVYFRIPPDKRLGPGKHRIHFVVRGDHSTADQYIHVLRRGERVIVSDVDGTLTESESAEFTAILGGASPGINPNAPEALWALADRGYLIFYVTARPDWLSARTHEWVAERGLPPGLVHTTNTGLGGTGSTAVAFKTTELAEVAARIGHPVDVGIGNKDSDAEAYLNAGIYRDLRFLYQLTTDPMGGIVFNNYAELVPVFEALPTVCL
ncbi:MAG: phosphatidylinositol transfer protein [Deltaproteobacteria bacterium]|nr:phosphatidylinositol transfer protein [Deltaproteobacteria bacterium]